MIETQAELTADAVRRKYHPGAVVMYISGREIQLTSWPWFEGEGDDRHALVMARATPGDCTTNATFPYFRVMKLVRQDMLD